MVEIIKKDLADERRKNEILEAMLKQEKEDRRNETQFLGILAAGVDIYELLGDNGEEANPNE